MHLKSLLLPAALLFTLLAAACQNTAQPPALHTTIGDRVPRTDKAFADSPERFRFAVIGDRTGGLRPGVLRQAMEQLNWMQPEFVISVGDLIEGYTRDPEQLRAEWQELHDKVEALEMPFFYVVGNHDISNEAMTDHWREHIGADYYHFVYKDVLFLAVNTEDPPTAQARKDRLDALDRGVLQRAMMAVRSGPDQVRRLSAEDPEVAQAIALLSGDEVTISEQQLDYMRHALADHPEVRWTLLFMHKPAWRYDSAAFRELEALLADRPYTVFAGHYHYYLHERHHGRDYIQLGATGGARGLYGSGAGDLDHIMWITMTEAGPRIANIDLEGLSDHRGPREHTPATSDGDTP